MALVDLEEIVGHYWPLSRKTATRYYREIRKQARSLERMPRIGRMVPEFQDDFHDRYREIIFEQFRLIYRIEDIRVIVLRILDGRRLLTIEYLPAEI